MPDDFLSKPVRVMDNAEAELASTFYDAIQRHSNFSERSLQSKDYQVGVSDLGFCSEYTRRMLKNEPPEYETDALAAFIGTAIGAEAEAAIQPLWPDAICQAEVTLVLHGDSGRTYNLGGHPDIIDPKGKVIDIKTVNGLGIVRRTGPKQSQQFQRHGYAKAAYEKGLFNDDVHLEDVQVANVWIDRSAQEHECWVHMEPYSPEVVEQAAWWLDDVVYAYLHEEEARKEPPIEFCKNWCGYFNTCRAGDGQVEGLLTDHDVLAAVAMQQEANNLERQAKLLKAQAKAALTGVAGSTGEFSVRWVHVNGGHVSFDRAPYDKLEIRKVK